MELSAEEFDSIEKEAFLRISERNSSSNPMPCVYPSHYYSSSGAHPQKEQKEKRFDVNVTPHEAYRHPLVKGLPIYLLYESASGYAIFIAHRISEIGAGCKSVENYLTRFDEFVKLKAFRPFKTDAEALEQFNYFSNGILSKQLRNFLNHNFPKPRTEDGKHRFVLGVNMAVLGHPISVELKFACESGDFTREVFRGVRLHFGNLIKDLKLGDLERDQVVLARNYSRQMLLSSSNKGKRKKSQGGAVWKERARERFEIGEMELSAEEFDLIGKEAFLRISERNSSSNPFPCVYAYRSSFSSGAHPKNRQRRLSLLQKKEAQKKKRFDVDVTPHEAYRHPHVKGLPTYLLYESASGYAIFIAHRIAEIGDGCKAVENYLIHFHEFVKLKAFCPFESDADVLEQFNAFSNGIMSIQLRKFLNHNFPKPRTEDGKHRFVLGVNMAALRAHISDELKFACESGVFIREVMRGVRLHFGNMIKDLKLGDLERDQVVLARNYNLQMLSSWNKGKSKKSEGEE